MSGELQAPDNFPPRVISCYPVNRNGLCAIDKSLSPYVQSTPISSRIKVNHFNLLRKGVIIFTMAQQPASGPRPSLYRRFTITLRLLTFGRTPLDELSARRRDLYLKTHNIHNRQTSMPPAGFEPTIPANKPPQTHALDRPGNGIG
jgi:hypothetical protein